MTLHDRVLLAVSSFVHVSVGSPAWARELTVEDRVVAQKAIEQVDWSHRSWPKENPGAKPALSAVMPDEVDRAKVADYLKKSNALDERWGRPITAQLLQAEMARMARGTRQPRCCASSSRPWTATPC